MYYRFIIHVEIEQLLKTRADLTARVVRPVGPPKIKTNRKIHRELEQKYVLQRMCKSVRNLSKEAAVYFGTIRVCARMFFFTQYPRPRAYCNVFDLVGLECTGY